MNLNIFCKFVFQYVLILKMFFLFQPRMIGVLLRNHQLQSKELFLPLMTLLVLMEVTKVKVQVVPCLVAHHPRHWEETTRSDHNNNKDVAELEGLERF